MNAIETVLGSCLNAVAVLPLDTAFKTRSCTQADLLDLWTYQQNDGFLQIFSRTMPIAGNIFNSSANENTFLNKFPFFDTIPSLEIYAFVQALAAIMTQVDYTGLNLYYKDSPVLKQRLISYNNFRKRLKSVYTVGGFAVIAARRGWNGLFVLGRNEFKKGVDYAYLGAEENIVNTLAVVTLRGQDTGGLRVGLPPETDFSRDNERCSFLYNAEKFPDLPLIPIISGENAETLQVEMASNELSYGLTAGVFLHFAELHGGVSP